MVLRTLDFGWVDVRFWLCRRWILVCVDIGLLLYGRWVFVGWMLDCGCVDVGSWLYGRWILIGWMLDFGCLSVG